MGETLWSICKGIIFVGLVFFGMHSCFNSDWFIAQEKQKAIAAQAAAIPHVIRDVDGCKVYAFASGGMEHYYTRCGATVTTERNYTVNKQCGKTQCTERKQETIVTEGNK
jgi:hypothetical protein